MPTHIPPTASPTVSTAIADVLAERASHLFGLMGNGNAHLISHLTSHGFPFTSGRHEAAAVAMADAYYRACGRIAAATTTYGAGFTNAYTALAEARLARVPLVLIVGDAPSTGPRPFDINQTASAEAIGVVTLVAHRANTVAIAHRAFDLALRTVQPVVLAIPYDLATEPLDGQSDLEPMPAKPVWNASGKDLDRVAGILRNAQRPLLLAGRGVLLGDATGPFKELGDRLGAMFMTSVMATNLVDSPWNLGIAGGFAREHRLDLARQADVVLVAGASMNSFQHRYGTLFGPDARVIRIDNEPPSDHPHVDKYIRADLAPFLEALTGRIPTADEHRTWRHAAAEVAEDEFRSIGPYEDPKEFGPDGRLNPRTVVAALEQILPPLRSIVMDGGHFMGWAPMYLSVPDPQAMVLVGTAFQSIGLGFSSAPGVSIAHPERTTVFITGDGGGLMGLADFETFLRTTRRGVVIALNDAAYGAELHQYASKGLDPTAMLIDEVDFSAIGRALGAAGHKATTLEDLKILQDWLAKNDKGVFVLDVAISREVIVEWMSASLAVKQDV